MHGIVPAVPVQPSPASPSRGARACRNATAPARRRDPVTACRSILLLALLLCAVGVAAATHAVDTPDDEPDAMPGNGLCATAAGSCTLRAAIEESNAQAGADTIAFSLSGTLTVASSLPDITGPLDIDGTTAPGYAGTPVIRIDANDLDGAGLTFLADARASRVRGVQVSGFRHQGLLVIADEVRIEHNFIGPLLGGSPNGDGLEVQGAGVVVEGNTISGNLQAGLQASASGLRIVGNRIGLDIVGMSGLPNDTGIAIEYGADVVIGEPAAGNRVGCNRRGITVRSTQNLRIEANHIGVASDDMRACGNADAGIVLLLVTGGAIADNVIAANGGAGLADSLGRFNVIDRNRIGYTGAGDTSLGNAGAGIALYGTQHNAVTDNVIAGNRGHGIELSAAAHTLVQGNLVGLATDGITARGNHGDGVRVGGQHNRIGASAQAPNHIVANAGNGIASAPDAGPGNTWTANRIDANGALGIDVGLDGPDRLPEIALAVATERGSQVAGFAELSPGMEYRIDLYANEAPDPSGYGEGRSWLGGSVDVADADGRARFVAFGLPPGAAAHATVTLTTAGGSSEFSANRAFSAAPRVQFAASRFVAREGAGRLVAMLSRSGPLEAHSSVRVTSEPGSAQAGLDYVGIDVVVPFLPGESQRSVEIALIDDTLAEPVETASLQMQMLESAEPGAIVVAQLQIVDDDTLVHAIPAGSPRTQVMMLCLLLLTATLAMRQRRRG